MVIRPGGWSGLQTVGGQGMSWNKVIEAHTSFAVKIYKPDQIDQLSRESGIKISADGSNTANSRADVEKYLKAVERCFGASAIFSAEMKITNKMRELNLGGGENLIK